MIAFMLFFLCEYKHDRPVAELVPGSNRKAIPYTPRVCSTSADHRRHPLTCDNDSSAHQIECLRENKGAG